MMDSKQLACKVFEETFTQGNKTLRESVHAVVDALEQRQQLPKPTHYTTVEGGTWFEWDIPIHTLVRRYNAAHAIKFDNGAIFDMVNGWRTEPERMPGERLVPRYPDPQNRMDEMVGQDSPSIPDCAYFNGITDDFCDMTTSETMGVNFWHRWYARRAEFPKAKNYLYGKPIEIVSTDQRVVPRALLEGISKMLHEWNNLGVMQATPEGLEIMHKLDKALATEKSELKAP